MRSYPPALGGTGEMMEGGWYMSGRAADWEILHQSATPPPPLLNSLKGKINKTVRQTEQNALKL